MPDLHQTRTVPARDVQVGWEIREQGRIHLVVKREDHGDFAVRLSLGHADNVYPYHPDEPLTVKVPVSRFVVEVTGCSGAQAAQVMAERLGHDEDYGFHYTVDWAVTG